MHCIHILTNILHEKPVGLHFPIFLRHQAYMSGRENVGADILSHVTIESLVSTSINYELITKKQTTSDLLQRIEQEITNYLNYLSHLAMQAFTLTLHGHNNDHT